MRRLVSGRRQPRRHADEVPPELQQELNLDGLAQNREPMQAPVFDEVRILVANHGNPGAIEQRSSAG